MIKDIWTGFVEFLKKYDFQTLLETWRTLEWQQILMQPGSWLVIILFLFFVVWTKRFRLLLLAASVILFFVLLDHTLPPAGEQLTLEKLLTFVGGSIALVSANVYFLFIREA